MGLKKYQAKRNFGSTAEPKGKSPKAKDKGTKRLFVIQKHYASRLHYDLRLEHEGVLKSWAVPKGPSLDPTQKRLAVQVEDHPVEYGSFEGSIPKGNYGAGDVILWDTGEWEPITPPAKGFKEGHLKFDVYGKKLHGRYALVRMKNDPKNWLFIKETDEFARPETDYSITEEEPDSINKRQIKAAKKPSAKKTAAKAPSRNAKLKKNSGAEAAKTLSVAPKEPLPSFVQPELATRVDHAPDGDDWVHEIKLDGYRLLARKDGKKSSLISRNNLDWTAKAKGIAEAIGELPCKTAILDGEWVVLDERGVSAFQNLQGHLRKGEDAAPVFFAFDILHLDGKNLRDFTLLERKAVLEDLIQRAANPAIKYSEHIVGRGGDMYAAAAEQKLEGIMSKRADSKYISRRTKDWLKVKCDNRQEFVILGFTASSNDSKSVGALLLGVANEKKGFSYSGKIGTGFSESDRRKFHKKLSAIKTSQPAVDVKLSGATWVKPIFIAQVAFRELTNEGLIRQGVFHGMREDLSPNDVGIEPVLHTEAALKTDQKAKARANAKTKVKGKPAKSSAELTLTHPDRVIIPDTKFTKQNYADYLDQVAEEMMKEIKDRPLSLLRCPEGIKTGGKGCFFQKHLTDSMPDTIEGLKLKGASGKTEEYFVVTAGSQLRAFAQISALELHCWNSKRDRLEFPDRFVIDLDPDPGLPGSRVISTAKLLREVLRELKLESFVRVSGGKGLHVVVPLSPVLGWDEVKEFSKQLVSLLERSEPGSYTTVATKAKRKNKIFLDYLRNGRGATSIANFSLRARPKAPCAVPIDWDELTTKLSFDGFTPDKVLKRIRTVKDPWKTYWTLKQTIPSRATEKLKALKLS